MPTITPFVRCNNNAKDVATYYLSTFPGSTLISESQIVVEIELFGRRFAMLNGGDHAVPNPSISFSLWLKDQELTKQIRDALMQGGEALMPFDEYFRSPAYGRCNDKYNVSRQVMYDDREATDMHQIVPSLMFTQDVAGKAAEAIDMYTNLFPNSHLDMTRPYGENADGVHDKPEHLAHAEFYLDKQVLIASDSGIEHKFTFDDGVSLLVLTDGQEETDYYRNGLIADNGKELQCGWCTDKFGVRWQVVPKQALSSINDPDPVRAKAAMEKMMTMKKIILADLDV